jgi:hypothetical protein
MPLNTLRGLRSEFLRAHDQGSELRYLWIGGDCCTYPPIRDVIVEAVTEGLPSFIPNTHSKPLWAFYSAQADAAFARFNSLARLALEVAVDGLNVWEASEPLTGTVARRLGDDRAQGRLMPLLMWGGGEQGAAESWCEWLEYLGDETGNPLLRAKVGLPADSSTVLVPLHAERLAPACPKRFLLADQTNLCRSRMDENGRTIDDPRFDELADAIKLGEIDDVAVFDRNLFFASTLAIDALVARVERARSPAPPDAATVRRLRDELEAAQAQLDAAKAALDTEWERSVLPPYAQLPPSREELIARADRDRRLRPYQDKYAEARRLVRRVEGEVSVPKATVSAPLPPLDGTAEKAAAYIDAHPGRFGKQIASGIDTPDEYFRQIFIEQLKPRGYHNVPGKGYFGPGVYPV